MVDNYYYLPNAFDTGSADVSPELWELKDDTEHPQFNARQFMYEISTRNEEPKGFLPFFCDIDTADGLFAVATNTFTSHNWDGNAIGAKDFNTIVNHDIANIAFSFTAGGTVTCLKWLQPTVVSFKLLSTVGRFSFLVLVGAGQHERQGSSLQLHERVQNRFAVGRRLRNANRAAGGADDPRGNFQWKFFDLRLWKS